MASASREPIAIIGMGCRFPGQASSPSRLWQLLREPRDVSQEIPADRFNISRFYHPDGSHHGTTNVKRSYFLSEDIRCFDSQFFGIPPAEAEPMDPQHRVLLEVVYEALESAGLPLEALHGSDTATYVGLMCSDYYTLQAHDLNAVPTYNATGIANSNASSRISYAFNWHGPSMTIDTACSSSLVAVHEAVQVLRSGGSHVAVAAGTNLLLSPLPYVSESKLNMLSPTGRSRMWDADADGYARGEGVGAVILKTLSAALRDGDPITAIIRETGVNQDGRTKGITMPSALAQAALIKDTYTRAGLDPTNKRDRCQYFEAHGTGTPAGDPQEAEALSSAFFPFPQSQSDAEILYVGSVKTVIGHTEGTAGIAGLIKACLALQNSVIPPNLHFNRLNPALESFTRQIRVPTGLLPWLAVPDGCPRRVSVNSFGFGGTNAHAILESYSRLPTNVIPSSLGLPLNVRRRMQPVIPFVFSATSQKSLIAVLHSHLSFIQEHAEIDLCDLAHSLASKRSSFPVRLAVTASSTTELCNQITRKLDEAGKTEDVPLRTASSNAPPSILGIFTGQGAQWATMGMKLIDRSWKARETINALDNSLAALPEEHRPRWCLMRELMAKDTSRIAEAEIAQPLCTAIQIVLVDILRAVGVSFTAVVGHSSGEIAAAYAAGFIAASDAIRIAYYRGMVAKLAHGVDDKMGAMMAVRTTLSDARELCELEEFQDRLCAAAHNSADSVTLSGDVSAIHAAKVVFDEERKFTRILKVDTAYHSHHMTPSVEPYAEMLAQCDIQILCPAEGAPRWYSTVHAGIAVEGGNDLNNKYWVDNMRQPVLFVEGLEACVNAESPNFVLEVGAHPALRGPASETIRDVTGSMVPYSGTLSRGVDDIEAIGTAIGSLWKDFGSRDVNLRAMEEICHDNRTTPHFLPNLPTYPWDHERTLWAESRLTRLFRTQEGGFHDLLGVRAPDGTGELWRWRNVLKTQELPWLSGHVLQGQMVFPGTGYVALAIEGAVQLAGTRPVAMIELCNLEIRRAIAINDTVPTELMVTMTDVCTSSASDEEGTITANFATFSTISRESTAMTLNTSGHVRITIGTPRADIFPPRTPPAVDLRPVDIDRFYSAMRDDLGYMYEGPFRGLTSLYRRLGKSSGTIAKPLFEAHQTPLLFHPGMLDNALQGLFAAYSAPGDGRLWSMRAPTACRQITLIPSLCGIHITPEVSFDCTVTDPRDDFITGNVDVYLSEYSQKIIEFEGLSFAPFAPATAKDDRCLFQESILVVNKPDGALVFANHPPASEDIQKAYEAERAAFFYLRNLHVSVDQAQREALPWYRQTLLDNAARVVALVEAGSHPYAPLSWLEDTHEQISEIMDRYGSYDADSNLTRAVGENLLDPSVLAGEKNILEFMTQNDYLANYYTNAVGFGCLNSLVSGTISQIAHKYPRLKICEIGAGTGGATGAILDSLGDLFSSYTYTDISSGFFENAQVRFQQYADRMEFRVLNIESDPVGQGFVEHAYDLVVAANVLHATKSLEETLRNVRRLLKPGGFLVLVEIIGNDIFRVGLVMGGLPGWWVGRDDGRRYAPTISLEEWDALMQKTGFSGVDTFTPMPDKVQVPGSVLVSQAVDEAVDRFRRPLELGQDGAPQCGLTIIGGRSPDFEPVVQNLICLLQPHFTDIIAVPGLCEITSLDPGRYVLSVVECEQPIFAHATEEIWEKFKAVIGSIAGLLWVTKGSQLESPYAGITVGLFRSLALEVPDIPLQLLDFCSGGAPDARMLAEMLLQLQLCGSLRYKRPTEPLWTVEPELFLRDGRLHVARVRPQAEQNDRYNSFRRSIVRQADIRSSATGTLVMEWIDGAYCLREKHNPITSTAAEDEVTINVEISLLSSLKIPCGFFFVHFGVNQETKERTLAFSTSNASVVTVPKAMSVAIANDEVIGPQYMSFVVAGLMSHQILEMVPATGTLLLHEPDPGLASLISKQISKRGGKMIITTSQPKNKSRKGWLYLHERSTAHVIKTALQAAMSMGLDFMATLRTDNNGLGAKIAATIPPPCERATLSSLLLKEASSTPHPIPASIPQLLRRIDTFATSQLNAVPDGAPLEVISLQEIATRPETMGSTSLIGWDAAGLVPVQVEPITRRRDLFRNDRAYWLAGLSGDLGQSLSDFMIEHGARYVALSSRRPTPCDTWVEDCRRRGAKVSFFTCDLVDPVSVQAVHAQITQTMAHIGGVANGALVLRDTTVATMSFDAFQTVIRPKVDGTVNLDKVCEGDTLEWFIAFSSIIATTGNMGQAAYSAANCFMKAVVHNRRSRGLAGSVIDIPRVLGVGYVERETQAGGILTKEQTHRLMRQSGILSMSEPDLHQLFAEAIIAGRPGTAACNPEIITGLSPIQADEADATFWAKNPRFSLLVREHSSATAHINQNEASATQIPVRSQLQSAGSPKELRAILLGAVSNKLAACLFLPSGDTVSPDTPLIDMGVDSLVGVALRTWLIKELSVDVPVLKILGGASVSDLVDNIIEQLPEELNACTGNLTPILESSTESP
ncbi:putative polyketide synthase [Aspergillus pseudoustus]|uniref:Polyketide synthase n=1 Tax=Aspergillus pseudoustus TaxID=1810923 RepID=A0ABR4IZA4_9EURO